ncbi:MAG: Xaa-Pro peptidase family protein [Planctomycetota bacterium]
MVQGIGDLSPQESLDRLTNMTDGISVIAESEFRQRLQKLQLCLQSEGYCGAYLHAGTNLQYFTGLSWSPSERMVGAFVPDQGEIVYIAPKFELDTIKDYWKIQAEVRTWEEHQSPYLLLKEIVENSTSVRQLVLCIDEATPFFTVSGIQSAASEFQLTNLQPISIQLRSLKSATEIALIQRSHQMTMAVIKAAAAALQPGVTTTEVTDFINQAYKKVGSPGSYFCIVLFGVTTSFPHGVKNPQTLQSGDAVLIDTGCRLDGYHSDITRSFCFGEPSDDYRNAWNVEKLAQTAAFEAAKVGKTCESCDDAARQILTENGYGPDYQLPGLPHRTGHGCGLDIHESPNLVRGEKTKLAPGMVFSSEPMLVIPGQYGIRLEDHFYMNTDNSAWFTPPSLSIENPF